MMVNNKTVFSRLPLGQKTRVFCAGATLLLVLLAAYANSFHAAWHYDDYSNIVRNVKVHADTLSWKSLRGALSAGLFSHKISRPLAYLSFAVNHRFNGLEVFGYHVVNFGIHWSAAVFLFLFVRNMLKLPLLKARYANRADTIALIASLLWAVHPIQVTAVTNIVQRMASMAGMFYIMAMYFYLKGRLSKSAMQQIWFFGIGLLAAACAMLTKENAILILFALWLFDLMLVQGISRRSMRIYLLGGLGLALIMVLLVFLYTDPLKLFAEFTHRPFTRAERLLTQPRVLFFYLFLIVAPMTSHMGIVHDLAISRSLTVPWTTGISIAGLLAVVIGLCLLARRQPLISYCGLFFFINHLVESSFLNLELVYEHRNYIPSMLLFVPVGLGVVKSLEFFRHRPKFQWMIICTLLVLFAAHMHTTFRYNKIYESDLDTWSHVVIYYPRLSLGHMHLGKLYWDAGLFEKARRQFMTALENDRFNNLYQKGWVYYDLGMYQAAVKQDHKKALELYLQAFAIYPDAKIIKAIALSQLKIGAYRQAIDMVDAVLDKHPDDAKALMIKARCLWQLNHRDSAAVILENLRKQDEWNQIALIALIEIYSELNREEIVERLTGKLLDRNGGKIFKTGRIYIEQPELLAYVPNSGLLEQKINDYLSRHNQQQ